RPRPLGHHRRMGRPLLPSRSLLLRNHPRLPLRRQTRPTGHAPLHCSRSLRVDAPRRHLGPCCHSAFIPRTARDHIAPCRHWRIFPPRRDDALEQCYCPNKYFVLTNNPTASPPYRTMPPMNSSPRSAPRTSPFNLITIGRIGGDIFPLQDGIGLEQVETSGKYLGGSASNV